MFVSKTVEEFYNACHFKANGKFCGGGTKSKVVHHVPMSDAARRSNAVLRSVSSARKSKKYATAKKVINKSWAGRETGQGTGRKNVLTATEAHKASVLRRLNEATKAGKHVTRRQLTH